MKTLEQARRRRIIQFMIEIQQLSAAEQAILYGVMLSRRCHRKRCWTVVPIVIGSEVIVLGAEAGSG